MTDNEQIFGRGIGILYITDVNVQGSFHDATQLSLCRAPTQSLDLVS